MNIISKANPELVYECSMIKLTPSDKKRRKLNKFCHTEYRFYLLYCGQIDTFGMALPKPEGEIVRNYPLDEVITLKDLLYDYTIQNLNLEEIIKLFK